MSTGAAAPGAEDRRAGLAAGLAAVEERLAAACADAGRDRAELTLVVVTKFFPATDVALLQGLGVRDVGESRAQEALTKLAAPVGLTTHFIGQLQTNKAADVVGWADLVHTVDRSKLVRALARAAAAAGTTQRVLLQVSLDPPGATATDDRPDGRGGVDPGEALALASLVAEQGSLELAGVMGVAPLDGDPDQAFGRLAEVARGIRSAHPGAVVVSAGMSGDLEAAVRHGATHLRVGSAILGPRPAVR